MAPCHVQLRKLLTQSSRALEFGTCRGAPTTTPTTMPSAVPEPTQKLKTEPEGDENPQPVCPWLQGEQQLSVPRGDNPLPPVSGRRVPFNIARNALQTSGGNQGSSEAWDYPRGRQSPAAVVWGARGRLSPRIRAFGGRAKPLNLCLFPRVKRQQWLKPMMKLRGKLASRDPP